MLEGLSTDYSLQVIVAEEVGSLGLCRLLWTCLKALSLLQSYNNNNNNYYYYYSKVMRCSLVLCIMHHIMFYLICRPKVITFVFM